MRFDDLDVEVGGQRLRGDAHQLARHRDAQRGVGRDQHTDVARRGRDACIELGAVAGGADHDGHARRAAHVERAQRQFGAREIDRHLRSAEVGSQFAGNGDAERGHAGELADVTAE